MTNSQQKASTPPAPDKPSHVPEPLIRSVRSTKIQPRHLERSAIVYVRQSTPIQCWSMLNRKPGNTI